MVNFKPIGYIKTEYDRLEEIPKYIPDSKEHCLVINKELKKGLNYLDNFNYIYVIFYLDLYEEDDISLEVKKDDQNIGVFATRSPERPNKIGLSVVKIIKTTDNRVYISGIDALDGTPILDIKPYINELDVKGDANSGWLRKNNQWKDKIYLYTDGSCSGNPGYGGYAALIIENGNKHEVSGFHPDTTNNRMELMAVIEGLKEIRSGSRVRIFSDSNYVIKGIQDWINNWKKKGWKTAGNNPVKNKDLWMELDKLTDKYMIEFEKVKGHSGDKYNEIVDTLAREQIEAGKKEC
ncbi:MAG: ribonuclease HI [Halanaerobiaceae bacterium]